MLMLVDRFQDIKPESWLGSLGVIDTTGPFNAEFFSLEERDSNSYQQQQQHKEWRIGMRCSNNFTRCPHVRSHQEHHTHRPWPLSHSLSLSPILFLSHSLPLFCRSLSSFLFPSEALTKISFPASYLPGQHDTQTHTHIHTYMHNSHTCTHACIDTETHTQRHRNTQYRYLINLCVFLNI